MLAVIEHEWVAAISALGSALGSISSATISYRVAHRRAKTLCDERIEELKEAFRSGRETVLEDLEELKPPSSDLSDWGGG